MATDVRIGKGELKAYLCNVVNHMDEDSVAYERFSELFLTACGVIDGDGKLTEAFKDSPYWAGGEGGVPLHRVDPVVNDPSKALSLEPSELRRLVMG